MSKTLEELEKELAELKESHSSMWDTYGSELCPGDMIRQEEKLEKEIEVLRKRQETINRWEKSGLLEGLEGNIKENCAELFESQLSYLIDGSDTTTQFTEIEFPVIKFPVIKRVSNIWNGKSK